MTNLQSKRNRISEIRLEIWEAEFNINAAIKAEDVVAEEKFRAKRTELFTELDNVLLSV